MKNLKMNDICKKKMVDKKFKSKYTNYNTLVQI
jgi:hypothetical protein